MTGLKLDAVLPLTNKDYARFEILRKSLERFFPDIGTCWVIVSDREYDSVSVGIRDDRYRVIAESTIIPELRFYDLVRVVFGRRHRPLSGWVTQQLRKLAIAQYVKSPFYLTIDADVICTRVVRYSDLIRDGRALAEKRRLNLHQSWYERAGRVLGVPSVSGWYHNLAPALLSREAVMMLQEHLAGRVSHTLRVLSGLLAWQPTLKNTLVSWRSHLLRNLPWTEYALYYTFLEATGLFDRYHTVDAGCALEGNSVWTRERFASWLPEASFCGERSFFFTVIQSSLEIPANEVWEKVRPYLEPVQEVAAEVDRRGHADSASDLSPGKRGLAVVQRAMGDAG